MPGRTKGGVFLSYARSDGEEFAAKLRERLRREAPDIEIKQDRLLLEGGIGWWNQLTAAIDSVDFLILVMTPAAMTSATVRKEWRYARQQGVCVYPVKAAQDSTIDFASLPRWMSRAHFYDLEKEWPTFLGHIRASCHTPRVPFMAPDLPENFVPRPQEFEALKTQLLRPGAITALAGAGGFGKTTLAAALCHDPDLSEGFSDGILWVTLGQNPDLIAVAVSLYAALTDERPAFATLEDAATKIAEKLADRVCLLVIDDAWDVAHLTPFRRGGKQCARLITTRNAGIVAACGANRVTVDRMTPAESAAILESGWTGFDPTDLAELADQLGNWALRLELGRALLRGRLSVGDSPAGAVRHLKKALDRKGPNALPIDAVIKASLDALSSENQKRLEELSIFPEDTAIPLAAAGELWATDEFDSEEAALAIANTSLAQLDLQRGTLEIHDDIRAWLTQRVTDAAGLHHRLVDAWPDWRNLPHEYAWQRLIWHLTQAGRTEEVKATLFDPAWIAAKLEATEVSALIAECEYAKPAAEADRLQGALRLSAQVLAKDKAQLRSQLAGRIGLRDPHLGPLVQGLPIRGVSFTPLTPTLTPPCTALLRTLAGHTNWVYGVAVTADGQRAVSVSWDQTLKVWDLETGNELLTLCGHTGEVWDVAATADGRLAASASEDQTLKVWDLEMGNERRTLSGHTGSVNGVAVTADGRLVVSASSDKTLKVWDLETGTELRTLCGHVGAVLGVAVTADGRLAVSASTDQTLKVWDLKDGSELHTLRGHTNFVNDVEVYANGQRAVSASSDQTLKVWDLETGSELRTLSGHKSDVVGVATTADGRRAVSASFDQTLKVWDLETGSEFPALSGDNGSVNGVAVTADGRRAVSASSDQTLKVWDLETGSELRTFSGHTNTVWHVAVTSDGRRAVSASEDQTLKIWDLEAGSELRTLSGHTGGVCSVALTVDGQRAVSASRDQTLAVWDLATGSEILTLSGHTGTVWHLAVTADGRRVVSASSDKTLKVWDLETARELRTLSGHTDYVWRVAVTADGRRAVSASFDATLKVWDLESGSELCTLAGHRSSVYAVVVTADGRRAVSASSDQTLKVWDLETGGELRTLSGHSDCVWQVIVAEDGRRALSASKDGTLKVWNLESGRELRTLSGHSGPVSGMAVTADLRRAVSASSDETLKVWDLESGLAEATLSSDWVALDCACARPDLMVAGDTAGNIHFLAIETASPRSS